MEEPIPPAPSMPWATTTEQLAYRRARNQAVERIQAVLEGIEKNERWLAQDDESPGYLPDWQRKTIISGLDRQRELLNRNRITAAGLTREITELDPSAPALLATVAGLVASARRKSPRLRLFTITVSPVAWRTLAPEFPQEGGTRVLKVDGAEVRLERLDIAVPDRVTLDCRIGQWSVHVPPACVPPDQPSRECYDQLRTQGYPPREAADATCDLAANSKTAPQEATTTAEVSPLPPAPTSDTGSSRRMSRTSREVPQPGRGGPARSM